MCTRIKLSLAVMAGGALGALSRFGGDNAIMAAMGGEFPLGILCINMFGSFLMGLLTGFLSRTTSGGPMASAFLGTGFLGGFTTFSSFALDSVRLCEGNHPLFALLNIGLNVTLCVLLAGAGWFMASRREQD